MSGGWACKDKTHRAQWQVTQRHCNHSAFNGYRRTYSAWSAVRCPECHAIWRTKGAFVNTLPDAPDAWWNS